MGRGQGMKELETREGKRTKERRKSGKKRKQLKREDYKQ